MRPFAFFLLAALADGELVTAFRRALLSARCSDKQAYTDMGLSQTQFSQQMSGELPPRFLARIWKIQNREVVKWYWLLLLERTGLPREIKRGTPIVLALMARKRMARASLHTGRFLQQRKERVS